ncbi:unnamed protein product [Brassicogethes aeneus]|uniref:Uncharacterized protein n=1 Tax=Brassicogethes aeneus TaxID=1431903 RepID=A0A9P0BA63_BRAAE|nr:unnamed protein product [Brassicogethes aeneus]
MHQFMISTKIGHKFIKSFITNYIKDAKNVLRMLATTYSGPLRLGAINGYEERSNEIIYCYPTNVKEKQCVTVYFGGDVQDFTENMLSHRDNKNYIPWNLDNTARILQKKFPENHIVVVRPSRMEYQTFSCFENFVPSSKCGAPDHTPMHYALLHLEQLLTNISSTLHTMTDCDLNIARETSESAMQEINKLNDSSSDNATFNEIKTNHEVDFKTENWRRDNISLDKYDLIIVGFSKGCVVLNQFLYEFHFFKTLSPDDSNLLNTISKIKEMYWLDGGHSGGKNTWITSKPLLETLTGLGIRIHIHVTPYQIDDDRRPWVKKEEKLFHEILKKQEANIERHLHFSNIIPNINIHFELLSLFGKS